MRGEDLHNPAEGEDHKVSHAKKEAEVDDIIEDVIEGVSIHGGEASEDGGHDVSISVGVPEEGEAEEGKAEEYGDYTDKSPAYNGQGERDCPGNE